MVSMIGGILFMQVELRGGYLKWYKPAFPSKNMFELIFKADWTEKQCKLSIYFEGKKLNETNDEYTMLLPDLPEEYVWYPCITPFNKGAYCVIYYE